jgi:hypothetical protein
MIRGNPNGQAPIAGGKAKEAFPDFLPKRLSLLALGMILLGAHCQRAPRMISVETLLLEMVDFENLALRPEPFFKQAQASSYSRASRRGGDAWFDNLDVGQYVRTEKNAGRTEQVLADLKGPGAVTRFWSANPTRTNVIRFYFDGEPEPRLQVPFESLFSGMTEPFGPDFSYVCGTGGNLYYPLPYADSLKITIEDEDKPVRLYYEIGYRTYQDGTGVETFDPGAAARWAEVQARVAWALSRPEPASSPKASQWINRRLTIPPGESRNLPEVTGEKAATVFSARVLGTRESQEWDAPERAHNAYRFLVLVVRFDGQQSIATPLGDFFGSGPGVNPYENLFFTVDQTGRMTSRLLMPFQRSMQLDLFNAGRIPYTVEIALQVGPHPFADRSCHLRAQWKTLSRESWPPFDTNLLETTGEGKVVGTVYEIANDGLIWWGEGDQKVFIDSEPFPSTFGTGTEDDYGFAYGYNGPFVRPFHAQTRVDGPASGGHISLNRWYVLDVLPYRSAVRFDQEIWHWMPCRPTWRQVIYWYARPGTPGPSDVDPGALTPVDLGIRENMLDPIEGETLRFETTGGKAAKERLANCSGAEHLVWRGAKPNDRLIVQFPVLQAGRYSVEINLCKSPDYGRMKLSVNGKDAGPVIDDYSPTLDWQRAKLGLFDLQAGDNTLEIRAMAPNPEARPGNLFGLDYIFLVRHP